MNENKPTLVILAAGMGSRYGGLKQLDTFTPEGDTIIFGKRNKQEERTEAKETIILVKTSAQAQIMVSDQEER